MSHKVSQGLRVSHKGQPGSEDVSHKVSQGLRMRSDRV